MEKLQIASKILLSLALIYFSTAIIMLVLETGRTREAIPEILAGVAQIQANVHLPEIIQQVSGITKEVSLVREEIPAILLQVEETRKAIPPILKQVEETRKAIPPILGQVEETRKIIPPILKEVEAVREALPESLDKAQRIVTAAKEITLMGGVTRGVGGAAKGVVTAPLKLFESEPDKNTGYEEEAK